MNQKRISAIREVNVAEILMLSEDYTNAREKLLKAKQLFPQLDDIGPMLTVCAILVSAKSLRLSGHSTADHYWVLELSPSSTFSDVNSRYHNLVALLLSVKNKFPGTDLALQFIQSAYQVLSDQDKRSEFDSRRTKILGDYDQYGFKEVSSCQILQDARNGDFGLDLVVWHDKGHDEDNVVSLEEISIEEPIQEFYNFDQNRKAEVFEAGQVWAVNHYQSDVSQNYRYAQIITNYGNALRVAWYKPMPFTASERRWRDSGLPVSCGYFHLDSEMCGDVSPMIFSYKCPNWVVSDDQFARYPSKGEIWAVYKNWNLDEWGYNPETMSDCKFDLVEMITHFSQYSGASCVHLVKLDGFRSVFKRLTDSTFHIPPQDLYIFSHSIPAHRLIGGGDIDHEVVNGIFELDLLALPDDVNNTRKEFSTSTSTRHNWSKDDFIAGQVWAIYCGENTIPQQYTRINNVISETTQVCVTFLEPEPVLDHDLPVACGMFRLSKTCVMILEMSQFSHPVRFTKSKPCNYMIYPKKGEVWAMYKNWSCEWKKHCDYESTHQCCVVEILWDLLDGNGMLKIARLGEVEGCLTFFRRQQENGFELVQWVPESEMLSFSHQIPAFKVTGIGSYGIPEGSWHLEPCALPPKHNNGNNSSNPNAGEAFLTLQLPQVQ